MFNKIALLVLLLITACSQNKNENDNTVTTSHDGMVLIPAGSFMMGGKTEQADQDEFPRHEVAVSAFYMDETEITNAQFKEFVDATDYKTIAERDVDWEELKQQLPPGTPKPADELLKAGSLVFTKTSGPVDLRDYSQWWSWVFGADWKHPEGPDSDIRDKMNYPAVHISWEDAQAYAVWAGKRLPTEAEWEWAAMGGKDNSIYPWGNDPIDKSYDKANFWQGFFPYENLASDGFVGAAPVKSFPPNGYGLYDMAGNVWEWCQDKYHYKAYQEDKSKGKVNDPVGPEQFFDPDEPYTPKYVIRGGSFLCNDSYCSGYRVSRRMKSSKDSGYDHTGFRCVKDI